ncbi:ATP-binding protein [Mesorhizobium sp. KR1-2]|uniref:ATP-binding protein n=1 Tax=Mesorhizobium sp. KR1-2 TaxID=3156609 RepID=UPI0032B59F09
MKRVVDYIKSRPAPNDNTYVYHFRPKYFLFIASLIFVAISFGSFFTFEWAEQEAAIAETYNEASMTSAPLAANMNLFLNTVDRSLRAAQEAVADATRNGELNRADVRAILLMASSHGATPLRFAAIDADGYLIATSQTEEAEHVSLGDRDYFLAQMYGSMDKPFVGNPVESRLRGSKGEWIVPISRPIRKDGHLLAVVTAAVPVSLIKSLFVDIPNGHRLVGIQKLDGTLLTSLAPSGASDTASVDIAQALRGNALSGGDLSSPITLSDDEYYVVWKLIPDKQLAIFTAIAKTDGLKSWTKRRNRLQVLLAACGLCVVAAGWGLDRSMNQRARREEAALEMVRASFASITDPLFLVDNDWKIAFANSALGELASQSVIGKNLFEAFPDIEASGYKALLVESQRSASTSAKEIHLQGSNLWLLVTVYPFSGGSLIYARNITEQKRTSEQLRHAQRMEMIGQLTGGIAHDFNNLLTVIIGNLEDINEKAEAGSSVADAAATALKAADRSAELTASLLAVGRRQALSPVPTDINALVNGLHPMMRRVLPESIDIEVVMAADAWLAEVDPGQVENAVLNLAVNARDAMPEGGKLTFETSNEYLDENYARQHNEVVPGPFLLLAISDTGHGMTPEVIDKAFDPFFTTKPEGKGSGLGLSMVQGFIKQSGGHIKIYSEIGQGSTIKLYLPRARKGLSEEPVEPTARTRGGYETILIVEDDELVRDHSSNLVTRLGYKSLVASNAEEALQILKEHRVDLLLTDVTLPGGMNGRQLADLARVTDKKLRVVYMSGYTRNAIIHHGRLDKGVDLLQKPFRLADLARILREVLDR